MNITPETVDAERRRLAELDPDGEAEAVEPLPPIWELLLRGSEDRAAPLSAEEIEADPVAAALLPPTLDQPRILLERLGSSYFVVVRPLGARFEFRDVGTDRDLTANLTVSLAGRHLFHVRAALGLSGRGQVAREAADLAGGDAHAWRRATFAAVEAVLRAEEQLGMPVDLRTAPTTLPAGEVEVIHPLWPSGSMVLVAPGEAGKSTIARACAVSLASSLTVIPGLTPVGEPRPVLYVAGEDAGVHWHTRSIEAICLGVGVDRRSLAQPIELYDARGRSLQQIARAIAERAGDVGAIILDSLQSLLPQTETSGGIRDRDGLFWNTVDQLGCPTAVLGHPNRNDAMNWSQADGRLAGSEVNRDRVRMAWRGAFRDELAVEGTSFRRYCLTNTKNNHGPREAPLGFAASWEFGSSKADPGVLRFVASEPFDRSGPSDGLTRSMVETLAAYRAGATTTDTLMAAVPSITSQAAARKRLERLRAYLAKVEPEKA